MLQFGGTLYNVTVRRTSRTCLRLIALSANQFTAVTSDAEPKLAKQDSVDCSKKDVQKDIPNMKLIEEYVSTATIPLEANDSVPQASSKFSTPKSMIGENNSDLDKKIKSSTTLEEILQLSTSPDMKRHHAVNLLSVISTWLNSGKIEYTHVQNDQRYIKLRKYIFNPVVKNKPELDELTQQLMKNQFSHKSPVMTLVQAISVLTAQKKRNVPLLKLLFTQLSQSEQRLNIKSCSDVLYSMAFLNLPHDALLQKIAIDLMVNIPKNGSGSVISSILTSLGIIAYKNENLLTTICKWVLKNPEKFRNHDICALLQTCATVGYRSPELSSIIMKLVKPLNMVDMNAQNEWVDLVWSLVLLKEVEARQIASVLSSDFIERILEFPSSISTKQLKLLNINAAARHLIENYTGPFIEDHSLPLTTNLTTNLKRKKDKQIMVNVLFETLLNLFPSKTYLNFDVNTGMGFIIDAVCQIDSNCNPVPIDQKNSDQREDLIRIAIMVREYRDFCHGDQDLIGINILHNELLKATGYQILEVSYKTFSKQLTLLKRVELLNSEIRRIRDNYRKS